MNSLSKGLSQWFGARQKKTKIPTLGAREIEVMQILWREGQLSAQQILDNIDAQKTISLSTMQTTLERLFRKELINREKTGRYFLYNATVSKSTIISGLMQDIALQISEGDMAPMISGFMEFIEAESPKSLNNIQQQVNSSSKKQDN